MVQHLQNESDRTYVTQAEAARLTGRDESTISTYVKAGRRGVGRLPTRTVGELIDEARAECSDTPRVNALLDTLHESFGSVSLVDVAELRAYISRIRVGRPRSQR